MMYDDNGFENEPEWYSSDIELTLSATALKVLETVLSIRVAQSEPGSPQYGAADGIREDIRDAIRQGAADGEYPDVVLVGEQWAIAYGAVYTVQFGDPPAAYELRQSELEAATAELQDEFPPELQDHIDVVTDGLEAMLERAGGADLSKNDD